MTTHHDASRRFAVDVVRTLREHGHQALWAGGCVRDHLVGRIPKDYDVATDAPPERVREIFGRRRTIPVGLSFGVVTVLGRPDALPIEVATFREDVGYSDGRHPDAVRFSSPNEDAQRRDFTINGLFFDPLSDEVHDYVGGRDDLAAGIVRAIGDPRKRFDEDRLRMLRAVRFATDFAFDIDPATWQAIVERADAVAAVSPERIAAELRRMLAHPRRAAALERLRDGGLLAPILPEIDRRLTEPTVRADVERSLRALSLAEFPTAMAVLIDGAAFDEPIAAAFDVARRLKLSNDERDAIVAILRARPWLVRANDELWPDVQPFLAGDHGRRSLEAARAWASDLSEHRDALHWCEERLAWPAERLDPPPLLDGRQLKQAGWKPGPEFGLWLGRVRREQLAGRLTSADEALAWIERMRSEA